MGWITGPELTAAVSGAGGLGILGAGVFPIRRFMVFPPDRETTGAVETMALYAGQSAGLVREQKPAGQIVAELMQQARELICTLLARGN
jgi:NAD(P)H-dependent flavin oxidoreductase YrpB (nitropropane dioxygenase family)